MRLVHGFGDEPAAAFFLLSLERRRALHVNVTAHSHAAWTAQQVVEAIATATASSAPRSTLVLATSAFTKCSLLRTLAGRTDLRDVGWAPYVENCLILGQRHLLGLVRSHMDYYNIAAK